MAAQCRSPRCTAERKGFRRELDSWRHRLIHCVGFESILEGLYGPGLRRDLSLFDDCEPELVDWCVDDKCSLCSLRKDTVDSSPSGGSAQSTPSVELISQGQFNTEKIEFQAENYLNALFLKKDLPQNCDPNIPLVAQELMKKMIRQFAIEYVSKSRKMNLDSNGIKAAYPYGCNGIQLNQTENLLQEEQDGPLDLTVSRVPEQTSYDDDGILDLSVKSKSNGLEENSKMKKSKIGAINGYFLRKMNKSSKLHKETTALYRVLSSWCLYHRQQIMLILKYLEEEQKMCSKSCFKTMPKISTARKANRERNSAATSCPKHKCTKCLYLNKQTARINLPCLSVCLEDLRLTWPNLNLGTVKLNPDKSENLHLESSAQDLHCINTRSKKKNTLFVNRCGVRRSSTHLNKTMVKYDLQCSKTECLMSSTNARVHHRNHLTLIKNTTFKNPLCSDQENSLKSIVKKAQTISFNASKMNSCFGTGINHLNPETDAFSLSNSGNSSDTNLKMTRTTSFHKNKKSIFDSSLSRSQNSHGLMDLNDSAVNVVVTTDSVKGQSQDILVLKDRESTGPENGSPQNITELPHTELRIHSKNLSCIKNSQVCLHDHLTLSAKQTNGRDVILKRKYSDTLLEGDKPPKRYSRNILGTCKLCDLSHGPCSVQKYGNLFCTCTLKLNSGILKNFKDKLPRATTDKPRNAHLKVVVEKLENSIHSSHNSLKGEDVYKRQKGTKCNGNAKPTSYDMAHNHRDVRYSEQVSQNSLNNKRRSNRLNSGFVNRVNHVDLPVSPESTSTTTAPNATLKNKFFSPIKLMFVTKVENDDGVKYSLSSEYIPLHENREKARPLKETGKHSEDSMTNNAQGDPCNHITSPRIPDIKSVAQNSPVVTESCPDEGLPQRPLKSILKNKRAFDRALIYKFLPRIKISPMEKNLKFSPDNTSGGIKRWKMTTKLKKSYMTEKYVVKNLSSTQIRIRKMQQYSERQLRARPPQNRTTSSHLSASEESSRTATQLENISEQESQRDVTSSFSPLYQEAPDKIVTVSQPTINSTPKNVSPCSTRTTRSKKPLTLEHTASSLSSVSSGSNLQAKSKKLHLNKCKVYKRKLRSYKHQPLVCFNSTVNDDPGPGYTTESVLSSNNVLEWWSGSTSRESLLQNLESRYEAITDTWISKNDMEKDSEIQPLSTLKLRSSETRSPVQLLFKKKCNLNDLKTWFMQTSETQAIAIGRKAMVCSPLKKINRKGTSTRTKQHSVASQKKKKKKIVTNASSATSKELHRVSTLSEPEACTHERNRSVKDNPVNIETVDEGVKDVCVKFACPGNILNVTKRKAMVQSDVNDLKRTACQRINAAGNINSAGNRSSTKCQALLENEPSKQKVTTRCHVYQSVKDCKVFLTKLRNVERKTSRAIRASSAEKATTANNYSSSSYSRTNCDFQMNQILAKPPSTLKIMTNCSGKKYSYKMCLRKTRRNLVTFDNRCKSSIVEGRKKQVSFFIETGQKRVKKSPPSTGEKMTNCPNFQFGPLKPVGIPAIQRLSSKDGTYSLTPIRIPFQSNAKHAANDHLWVYERKNTALPS